MIIVKNLSGMTLASAAATLLLAGCGGEQNKSAASDAATDTGKKSAEVKCSGINSCKGTGACGTATHACAGQNKCKGQGWIKVSKDDCAAKGGTVVSG